jgi:hypothetical protein
MASVASTWPILPGKLAAWRRLAAEMQGARREEYAASAQRLGATACRLYYQQTPQADLAVVYFEGADIGRFFQGMATSQDPYDVWFREQMLDIHGWDVTQPLPGPLPALVFEWQGR